MRLWPFRKKSRRGRLSAGADSVMRAAEDLAERSRVGEQNATSQLVVLGEQYRAGKGGAEVRRSYETILRYLRTHPPPPVSSDAFAITAPAFGSGVLRDSPVGAPLPDGANDALTAVASFGCDSPAQTARVLSSLPAVGGLPGATCAIVLLANAGAITPDAFRAAAASLPDEEARASFLRGADDPLSPPGDEFGFAGFVYGRAARVQAIRQGGHFGLLSPTMAWELGQ